MCMRGLCESKTEQSFIGLTIQDDRKELVARPQLDPEQYYKKESAEIAYKYIYLLH